MNEELELILGSYDALKYLKQKEILCSKEGNRLTYFKLQKEMVYVLNENKCVKLSFDDFLLLYEKKQFIIYQDNNSSFIDPLKDEQYYSWKHK